MFKAFNISECVNGRYDMARTRRISIVAAVSALILIVPSIEAAGGRGGGGFHGGGGGGFRGGFGGGGFGGFRGGGMEGYHPSFAARPETNFGGFNRGFEGARVSAFNQPGAFNRGFEGNRFGGINQAGAINRGFEGNRFGGINQAGTFNRGIEVNRNQFNNVNIQRNNFNQNVFAQNRFVQNQSFNRFNNYNFNGWSSGWRNPYWGYHSNWVHGYWNGGYGWGGGLYNPGWFGGGYYPGWGMGLGSGFYGPGLGWGALGLASWMYGPSLYSWGYSPYYNPFYVVQQQPVIVQQPVVLNQPAQTQGYDYSRPINATGAAVDQTNEEQAVALFDQARDAFKNQKYDTALRLTDSALAITPEDTEMRQFRALVLYAQGKYDQAAADLYAILAVGPGWDWTTLIGLYPGVEVYTEQLRTLEGYCRSKPNSAAARFVLAYHYLVEGHDSAAIGQFEQVSRLLPNDSLSKKLAHAFTKKVEIAKNPASDTPPAPPEPPKSTIKPDLLVGTWTGSPNADTTITLRLEANNQFAWKVKDKSGVREFQGEYTIGSDLLTLAQTKSQSPPMVGSVGLKDDQTLDFKIVGGGPDDPGIVFHKQKG